MICRDDWIRTSGLLHPMQTRYRAALRPELSFLGCKSKKKTLPENELMRKPYLRAIPYR